MVPAHSSWHSHNSSGNSAHISPINDHRIRPINPALPGCWPIRNSIITPVPRRLYPRLWRKPELIPREGRYEHSTSFRQKPINCCLRSSLHPPKRTQGGMNTERQPRQTKASYNQANIVCSYFHLYVLG